MNICCIPALFCTCCSLIFPGPLFSSCFFFLALISSDIPYLQGDTVSPVVYPLFLLQHDLMCLSNNKREQRERRGRRQQRKREGSLEMVCGSVSQTVQHFLCYLLTVWEKSIPPSILSSTTDKNSPDYSSLHKGKLIPQGHARVCAYLRPCLEA